MANSNHKVDIVVGVKDLASRPLTGIQKTFTGMQKSIHTTGTFLGAFNRNLDATINKMDRLANSMYKFNMYTSSMQRGIRNIGLAGAAVAGGIAYQGTSNALDFDYKTHIMQSRMETTSKVRKELEDYILKDLNLKVGYKPTQLADMGIILGQAGISNAADMKSMMKTTSYFSEAVDAVPEQAAEMIIAAAKGFGISMENSGQITDKLTVALNKSLLHVEEMPHAIGELAGRAKMFGQSFDSSLVALMTMRDAGMSAAQGSQDFLHALRQGSRIGNDSVMFKRTSSYFQELGITKGIFNQDTKQLKEFPDLIADIEKAMINSGFSNNKYGVKNFKDFQNLLAKNNGAPLPDDFWNSMKAMPLITRVFGAAGQAPILMALQSKYEEIDKLTGEKTGNVFYGSEAIKKRYDEVKNSSGAVQATHDIVADSGKFQLEILSGAWESMQIQFLDNVVPVLKTGAEQLTTYLSGNYANKTHYKNGKLEIDNTDFQPKTGLAKLEEAIKQAAENFRKEGHNGTASVIETTGQGIINGVKISKTMPPLFNQIGKAFKDNFVNAEWGSNIIEFPWHIVKNGVGFINDLLKANKAFQEAVSKLPKELQDPAKLVETLIKGGIVLLVTGAVVKTIELGVRGVSLALKGTKIATELTQSLLGALVPDGKKGGIVDKLLGKNMAITANVVNVYGKAINSIDGDIPGMPGGKSKKTPPIPKNSKLTRLLEAGKVWGPALIAADIASGAMGGPSVIKSAAGSKYNPLNPNIDGKVDAYHKLFTNPSNLGGSDAKLVPATEGDITEKVKAGLKEFFTPKIVKSDANSATNQYVIVDSIFKNNKGESVQNNIGPLTYQDYLDKEKPNISQSILTGFNSASEKLQNLKVQNNLSVNVAPPQVIVNGNMKDFITVETKGSSSFTQREESKGASTDRNNNIMQRRLGWR